jgi:hypothetical protein
VFCLHDARRSGIECLNIRNRQRGPARRDRQARAVIDVQQYALLEFYDGPNARLTLLDFDDQDLIVAVAFGVATVVGQQARVFDRCEGRAYPIAVQ